MNLPAISAPPTPSRGSAGSPTIELYSAAKEAHDYEESSCDEDEYDVTGANERRRERKGRRESRKKDKKGQEESGRRKKKGEKKKKERKKR